MIRTRHVWQRGGIAAALLGLSGCAAHGPFADLSVAAPPLCEATPGQALAPDGTCKPATDASVPKVTDSRDYLGNIAIESEANCKLFLDTLVSSANSTRLGLDGLGTVFGALGTAFTPLATVHAMSAGSAIASGLRTSIDSDIYAKAAIASYSQAIQSGYFTDIHTYLAKLETTDPSTLIRPIEVAKLETIHAECSLAAAQAGIASTMRPNDTGAATTGSQTVTVTAAGAAGDTFSLTGSGGPLTATLPVSDVLTAAQTPAQLAAALAAKVNGAPAFQAASVTATPGAATATSFTLNGPAGIKWTVAPAGKITIAGGTPVATAPGGAPVGGMPLPGAAAPTVSVSVSGGTTQSVVPGHPIR